MPVSTVRGKRVCQAVIALALGGLLAATYVEHEERQSVIRLAADDIQAAAKRLAKKYPFPPADCDLKHSPTDLDLLAQALVAVEQLATSRFETVIEQASVRIAVLIGLTVPDFSLGPGQISPSTVEAALQRGGNSSDTQKSGPDRQQIAYDLLQICQSHQLGVAVLKSLSELGTSPLNRDEIMRIAGAYNAQLTTPSREAALANYLYRELTYPVFQELKFRSLLAASANREAKNQE